jgi:hypothetical protein
MEMSGARRPPAARSSIVALALACAVWAQPAMAMSNRDDGSLSPRLAELAKPAVRELSPPRQAKELGVASSGPGSLLREGNRVLVDVRFDQGAIAGLDALRAAGAQIVTASRRYQTVTVAVAPASLRALAGVAGVEDVSENRAPLVYGDGESPSTAAVGATCEGGSVVSEGAGPPVDQLHVAAARGKYGVDGSGVTVGVLSDSYDTATTAANGSDPIATHASEDVASGDLTGSANICSGQEAAVNVLEDSASSSFDEGRAMLQIVHDVAPNASLAFATAVKSETSFAHNIEQLAKPVAAGGAGAEVIVDDVSWFGEPFFQDGPIAAAVNKVTAEGVTYLTAAGNNNLFDAGQDEIASWEAPSFRDALTCPTALLALTFGHCMDFNPNPGAVDDTFGMTVANGATLTVDLQWAEPWSGVETDLDAYLLDSGGKLLAKEDSDNLTSGKPVEVLQWKNTTGASKEVQLAVNRCALACNPQASGTKTPRLKFALLENGSGVTKTEYPVSAEGDTVGPTIFGHNGAAAAVSVGAIRYNATKPEVYSSRGPVTHYFGPVTDSGPAAALPSAEVIPKPDIVATDCGATTFFAHFVAGESTWRFCGTSAAAPHAAGVAALELQAKPSASVAEIRSAQTSTASTIPGFGSNAVGAGLLDADGAVESLLPPSAVTITKHPSSRTAESTPTFEFNPSTALTCFVDGVSKASPCPSPYTTESLSDGPHTFKVEGGGSSASFSFIVDTTPPTIAFAKQPAVIADATPTLAFSASEPARFTCSVDGTLPSSCSSPYAVATPLADGPHTLQVTGTDQVGNVGHGSVEFTVDTVAPKVSFTVRPPESTSNRTPTFAFASSEPATYTCMLDDFPPQPCGSPFTTPALADGPHTFEVAATDQAGNAGRASDSFTVDTRRPNTFFAKHPRRVIHTLFQRAGATFRFGSNETGVTFICKVDGGLLRFCDATLSRRFDPGKHFVLVKARDLAGNVDRTPAIFRFRVKPAG